MDNYILLWAMVSTNVTRTHQTSSFVFVCITIFPSSSSRLKGSVDPSISCLHCRHFQLTLVFGVVLILMEDDVLMWTRHKIGNKWTRQYPQNIQIAHFLLCKLIPYTYHLLHYYHSARQVIFIIFDMGPMENGMENGKPIGLNCA